MHTLILWKIAFLKGLLVFKWNKMLSVLKNIYFKMGTIKFQDVLLMSTVSFFACKDSGFTDGILFKLFPILWKVCHL